VSNLPICCFQFTWKRWQKGPEKYIYSSFATITREAYNGDGGNVPRNNVYPEYGGYCERKQWTPMKMVSDNIL
jgi:hypothetical protein